MTPTITNVAILGGDPVVGRTIELLLRGAGYGARFLPEPLSEKLEEKVLEAGLLLLTPSLSPGCREALARANADPGVPVLRLLSAAEADLQGLPWPCRPEELKRAIDNLIARPSPDPGGG